MAFSDIIDAGALLTGGVDRSDDNQGAGSLVGQTIADSERDLIIDNLKHTTCNCTHAAKILGISIRTLRNKRNTNVEGGVPAPSPGEA
ncbi:MAG: helix-turn-helix domain-containing protein [Rhodospirillaceae bacterium]|nr:helix-turn-helix domain-containing protein [Rhodospirillaceae bacterium]